MVDLMLSWQEAAISAGGLIACAAVARRLGRPRLARGAAVAQETAVLLGLFALWQLAGRISVTNPGRALARAGWIWHAERVTHMPSEALIQRFFLRFPLVVRAFNLYYGGLHFAVLIVCLAWLFARYRGQYPPVRTTVVLFTASALLIQLIPVAPPRMLPGDHMIDTAVEYGQSVYGSVGGFNPDQLSAMPSVHIGWALLVAVVVVHVSGSRWRWLALAYPAVTTVVVVVTANHFWLDGAVAALLLALVLVAQRAGRAVRRRLAGGQGRPGRSPVARRDPPQRRQRRWWLLPRWQLGEEFRGGFGHLADGALDRPLGTAGNRLHPADLAHVLARCGFYLGVGRLRLQAPEDRDVAAHSTDGTREGPLAGPGDGMAHRVPPRVAR
jgi:PAP2 superfamily